MIVRNLADLSMVTLQVLEMEPDNTSAMDWAAELLAELGDAEGAKELIVRSIELQPSNGYEKFVLLGHLEANMDAIYAFERGLELLKAEFDKLEGNALRSAKRFWWGELELPSCGLPICYCSCRY